MATECPCCGSRHVAPVIYSMKDLERMAASSGGGRGWQEDPDAPNWECQDCHHRWPDPRRLEVAREVIQFYRRAKADLAAS